MSNLKSLHVALFLAAAMGTDIHSGGQFLPRLPSPRAPTDRDKRSESDIAELRAKQAAKLARRAKRAGGGHD